LVLFVEIVGKLPTERGERTSLGDLTRCKARLDIRAQLVQGHVLADRGGRHVRSDRSSGDIAVSRRHQGIERPRLISWIHVRTVEVLDKGQDQPV
jgi:hypothetical protein